MNKTENLELLKQVASTTNHDENGKFIPGETKRLDLIDELLKDTEYKKTEIGLCVLYSKKPLNEIEGQVTVISSHVDSHENITKPFSEIYSEKKLLGTYDNSITNAAVLTLMLEDRLPEHVVVAFTGNEENGMGGAYDLAYFLKEERISAKVIVTDVTGCGYKGKNVFSFENSCNAGVWTANIKKFIQKFDINWNLEGNNEDDETISYASYGFECFSFCIPTKGPMHSNNGLKVRKSTYHKYIEALCYVTSIS